MRIGALSVLGLLLSCSAASAAGNDTPKIDPVLGEQIVSIPTRVQLFNVHLEATIFKPKGSGPYCVGDERRLSRRGSAGSMSRKIPEGVQVVCDR